MHRADVDEQKAMLRLKKKLKVSSIMRLRNLVVRQIIFSIFYLEVQCQFSNFLMFFCSFVFRSKLHHEKYQCLHLRSLQL